MIKLYNLSPELREMIANGISEDELNKIHEEIDDSLILAKQYTDVESLRAISQANAYTDNANSTITIALTDLISRFNVHELAVISSENGLHGIRVWNNRLEQLNRATSQWELVEANIDVANLFISAINVNETSDRVFISATEKASMLNNSNDIANLGQKVSELETDIDNIGDISDEKVKIDENDTADYLGTKLDNNTIQVLNSKLVVMSLEGLLSSVAELNELVGITGNVQAQIDSLSNITNIQNEIADTEGELPQPAPQAGTMILVREDSTQNNSSTFYRSDGAQWVYINKINSDIARDFVLNPLNIATETSGSLPKTRYELPTALDVSFVDANGNIQATNTQDAIKELFTLSDSGKRKIVNAIGYPLLPTDTYDEMVAKFLLEKSKIASELVNRGVPAYTYNSLGEYAQKISIIPNVSVSTGIKTIPKQMINAGQKIEIELSEAFKITEVASSIIEHEDGASGVTHYDESFDESSKVNYVENKMVDFNGQAKLKNSFIVDMDNNQVLDDGYIEKKYIVNSSTPYNNITGFKVVL